MTPFETDEDGLYLIAQPAQGMTPEAITLDVEGGVYRLSDYQGRAVRSRVRPDVLQYAECNEVLADGE